MPAASDTEGKKAGAEPFPWDAVMHAGLCLLRLVPKDFWALTPREFFAITGGLRPAGNAMDRGALDALMRTFPDDGDDHGR